LGGGQAGEIQFVALHCEADAVCFGLGRSNGRNEASIGDLSAGGDGLSFNEDNIVGTGGHLGADALGKAAEIVCQGHDPDCFVRTGSERVVFEGLAGVFINNSVGLWRGDVNDP
jgi:hypothetical protein